MLRGRNIYVNLRSQKRSLMFTKTKAYAEFSEMMLRDRIYEDPDVCYEDICAAMRVSPSSLDSILVRELGMKGREILYSFQKLLNL